MKKLYKLLWVTILTILSGGVLGQAVDLSFRSDLDAQDIVYAMELLDDGNIIVGGAINSDRSDTSRPRNIAQLNPDGSLDHSFNAGTGFNGLVRAMAIQGDGRILIGGAFTEFNGTAVDKLVRLRPDGTLDAEFKGSELIGSHWSEVSAIHLSAGGKIYIGGTGSTDYEILGSMILRLNADGSMDETFGIDIPYYAHIFTIAEQDDKKLLVGGYISNESDYWTNFSALRINQDGSLDSTFYVNKTRGRITNIVVQDDKKVLLGGHYEELENRDLSNIVRLEADGKIDETFDIGSGFEWCCSSGFGNVNKLGKSVGLEDILLLPDGKIIVVGGFQRYNGHLTYGIAKLGTSGTVEELFNSCGDGARRHNNVIYQSLLLPDGRVIAGGNIFQYENIPSINGLLVLSGEPTPNPSPIIDFDVITVGRKASFVNNSRHAFEYEWNFGDTWETVSGTNPVHIYSSPGKYTIRLKGIGFCGEAVSVSKEVSVFGVESFHPKKGGNQGYVTMTLTGLGFTEQTAVKLVKGAQEILGTTSFVSEGTEELQVYFDLTGKELGGWRLDVRNGGLRLEAKETFEIENVIAPEIHAEFAGRNQIRAGRAERLTVRYSNTGNVDALMVPLTLQFPSNVKVELFDSLKLINNLAEIVGVDDFREDTVSASIAYGDITYLPLIIPIIPARGSGEIEFLYSAGNTSDFNFSIISRAPFLERANDHSPSGRIHSYNNCHSTYWGMGIEATGVAVDLMEDLTPTDACFTGFVLGYAAMEHDIESWARSNSRDYSILAKSYFRTLGSVFSSAASCVAASGGAAAKLIGSAATYYGYIMAATGILSMDQEIIRNPQCFETLVTLSETGIQVLASLDPNEKVGPSNITEDNYTQGKAPFTYTIFYENIDSATAAAQEVIILDTLDRNVLDLSTFQLTGYGYGSERYSIPAGLSAYTQINPLQRGFGDPMSVRFDALLDEETGEVRWRFLSVDPDTGELIDDPIDGFLPPNKIPGEGEGYVTFSIRPKEDLTSSTRIENKALIYFDYNAPIITNTFVNTIDKVRPESRVSALPEVYADTVFTVSWSGEDVHAGIRSYDVFVSVNDGPYGIWQYDVSETSAEFTGHADSVYRFYSIGKDHAGNKEADKTQAEAMTQVVVQTFAIEGISTTNPTCTGLDNGVATVNVAVKGVTLEYSLDNTTFQDKNSFENLAPGDYTAYVRDKANPENVVQKAFTIDPAAHELPDAPTISIQGEDGKSQELLLVSSSATGNQWYKDGAIVEGATAQSIEASEAGTYHVVVTGVGGCSASSEMITITALPEVNNLDLKLYPNPADAFTTISLGREVNVDKIIVYSAMGVVLKEMADSRKIAEIRLDLKGLVPGIYFVQVQGTGFVERLKLIIR